MASKLIARRQQILELLSLSPICSTLRLSEETKVSSETIRKDLDALAAEGFIIKVHGGVALAAVNANEIPFDQRVIRHAKEKKQIARAAVQLVAPGDAIILEGCTTNLELAKALVQNTELVESLVIITNSLAITNVFDGAHCCRKLFFLGGWINADQYAAQGHHTVSMLENFQVNKAFISGAALSEDYILSSYYDNDVLFQSAAMKAAQQTILMLDHSKFGQSAIFAVTHLSQVDYIVTDKALSAQEKKDLANCNVHIVPVL